MIELDKPNLRARSAISVPRQVREEEANLDNDRWGQRLLLRANGAPNVWTPRVRTSGKATGYTLVLVASRGHATIDLSLIHI